MSFIDEGVYVTNLNYTEPVLNSINIEEMEEIEKGFQEARKRPVANEWIREDESDNEEEVPVTVVEVIKRCECGGEFEYTREAYQTSEYPPHYTHTCNKCGKRARFIKIYPYQKYERIETGNIQD